MKEESKKPLSQSDLAMLKAISKKKPEPTDTDRVLAFVGKKKENVEEKL